MLTCATFTSWCRPIVWRPSTGRLESEPWACWNTPSAPTSRRQTLSIWSGSAAASRRLCDLGVDLGTDQEHEARYVEPEEQEHRSADGAIGSVEVGEARHVEPEPGRSEQPAGHRHRGARRHPVPALADGGGQIVDEADTHEGQDQRGGPADRIPYPGEDRAHSHRMGNRGGDLGAEE